MTSAEVISNGQPYLTLNYAYLEVAALARDFFAYSFFAASNSTPISSNS
jgi:hypothetical protein